MLYAQSLNANLVCTYQPFNHNTGVDDSTIKYDKAIEFRDTIEMTHQFVLVDCYDAKALVKRSVFKWWRGGVIADKTNDPKVETYTVWQFFVTFNYPHSWRQFKNLPESDRK